MSSLLYSPGLCFRRSSSPIILCFDNAYLTKNTLRASHNALKIRSITLDIINTVFIMTSLWCWSKLCCGRSSSPIIRQWILFAEYVWVDQGCFWHCISHDKCCLLWQAFDIDQGYMLELIKAVSDTVLDTINAAYYDKPLIFTMAIHLSLSSLFLTLYLTWQMPLIMTNLWYLSGLCFRRSSSPIVKHWI